MQRLADKRETARAEIRSKAPFSLQLDTKRDQKRNCARHNKTELIVLNKISMIRNSIDVNDYSFD